MVNTKAYVLTGSLYGFAMLIATVIVPFFVIVTNGFTEIKNYAIASTVIYIYYVVTTTIMNFFNFYVLLKNSRINYLEGQCNFLFMSMLIGEISALIILHTTSLIYMWLIVDASMMFRVRSEILGWVWLLACACFRFSILSVTAGFIINMCQMIRRNRVLSVWVKIIAVFIPAVISLVSLFFEHMATNSTLVHIIPPLISGYLPLLIMFSVLIVIAILSRNPRFSEWIPKCLPLLIALHVTYLVLWLPYIIYFTYITRADLFDESLEIVGFLTRNVLLLKFCLNFFLFNIFDDHFHTRSHQLLSKILPCLFKPLNVNNPDGVETAIHYNADNEEAVIS